MNVDRPLLTPKGSVNHPVHACELVNVKSIQTGNLGFIEYFLRSNCGKLLDLGDEYYPRLVRMFCANVKTVKNGVAISLECQVRHTKFTLTELDLNHILSLLNVTLSPLS